MQNKSPFKYDMINKSESDKLIKKAMSIVSKVSNLLLKQSK